MDAVNTDSLLREVANLYERAQRHTAACCDQTHTECVVMTTMGRNPPMTLQQLARAVGLEKSWVSRVIDRLTAEGLIVKQPNAADGRSVLLQLTPAGQSQLHQLNATLNDHAERVLSHIPDADRDSVRRALTMLRDALKAEEKG